MKFMMLMYNDPSLAPTYGTPEFGEMMAAYGAANQRMRDDGVLRGGDGLHDTDAAVSVRVRQGKTEAMDGPFAETREYLGGYYIIEVADMATALTYAALIPSAQFGTVEVRPLMEYNPAG